MKKTTPKRKKRPRSDRNVYFRWPKDSLGKRQCTTRVDPELQQRWQDGVEVGNRQKILLAAAAAYVMYTHGMPEFHDQIEPYVAENGRAVHPQHLKTAFEVSLKLRSQTRIYAMGVIVKGYLDWLAKKTEQAKVDAYIAKEKDDRSKESA